MRTALTVLITFALASCSMGEEVRRIEASKQAKKLQEASRSTNLTGEQIFVRSCNTCHPGGKQGMGPGLADLNEHFKDDNLLKKLIRSGKGMMPAQPPVAINDEELQNLVDYLRKLSATLSEAKK